MPWELDEQQRDAVESTDRAVMVVAGPGTGKTRVLTARAAWLTESLNVNPSRILAITYTNRAAAEMRSRLVTRKIQSSDGESVLSPAGEVAVHTFHAWAYKLVRSHAEALGFDREPIVFDEDAQEQLLRKILGRNRIPEEVLPIRNLKQLIDREKAEIACPVTGPRFDPELYETVMGIFRDYQLELEYRNALDFADILLAALQALYLNPEIRDEVRNGIDHLLIDEFQDINPAQYRLIDALERPGMNLFAVGDEDQTIYAFRGSSGVFIDQFVADFGARLIALGPSYRCSDAILYAAGSVISRNSRYYQRTPLEPAGIREKPPLGVFELEDEEEEAHVVAKLIRGWANAGCSYRDIAVLYRVHSLGDDAESYLINNGIPVLRLLPERTREEISGDPLPLLRLASSDSEWDWDRAIGLPRDRLGELDDLRVRLAAIREGAELYKLLGRPTRFRKLSALAQKQLARLNSFVKNLRSKTKTEAPSHLLNLVAAHLDQSMSPWNLAEYNWLKNEEGRLAGFEKIIPAALLEEWRKSKDGIRICHAPLITSLIAAKILEYGCSDVAGIKTELILIPFELNETVNLTHDDRPVIVIGLDHPPETFFPTSTLLPRALYITSDGITVDHPDESDREERFAYALSAHRLGSELVGYRPGGGEDEILVFFDLETTGVEIYRSEIIEIAALKVLLKGGEAHEVGEFHTLIKPKSPIPSNATEVHGITDKDVKNSPSAKDAIPRFLDFIGDSPLAGHNIDSFDLPLVRRFAGDLNNRVVPNLSLDTLTLSRRLFPVESHRLGVLADKFGIDKGKAHRALDDVRTNVQIFQRMTEMDEDFRSRSFWQDLPIALSLAHGSDQSVESDPKPLDEAACRLLQKYKGEMENHPFKQLIGDKITDRAKSNLVNRLKAVSRMQVTVSIEDDSLDRRVQFLREEVLRLEDENPDVSLPEFLAHISLLTEGDFDSDEDAVRMMSLHAAKGLEFERVIILGMEQGYLPHRLALNKTVREIEEERRLFYVGLTRARTRAALFHARRRFGRWRSESMFLHELPKIAYKRFRSKDRVSGK